MAPFYKNVLRPATSWFRQVLFVGGARRNIAFGPVLKQFCQKKNERVSPQFIYLVFSVRNRSLKVSRILTEVNALIHFNCLCLRWFHFLH